MEKLKIIQQNLVVKKNIFNSYADFYYRSLETILEQLKPLLEKTNCTLIFNDELQALNNRIFIKSTCSLMDLDSNKSISSTAFAEIGENKKMSEEQRTGSASSYARKYACCSLFLIDDSQDVDSVNNKEKPNVDNLQILKNFCSSKKGTIEKEKLINFFRYWENRINTEKPSNVINFEKAFNTYFKI